MLVQLRTTMLMLVLLRATMLMLVQLRATMLMLVQLRATMSFLKDGQQSQLLMAEFITSIRKKMQYRGTSPNNFPPKACSVHVSIVPCRRCFLRFYLAYCIP